MKIENQIRLFGTTGLQIQSELEGIQKEYNVDLGKEFENSSSEVEEYFPLFPEQYRREAEAMSEPYKIFYCLENSVRETIALVLSEKHESDWWEKKIPEDIRKKVELNRKRELEAGVTPRSENPIDYTTFGELSVIINKNQKDFSGIFTSTTAVNKVLAILNTLRGAIAHCKPLAKDEVLRLQLAVGDWFRATG